MTYDSANTYHDSIRWLASQWKQEELGIGEAFSICDLRLGSAERPGGFHRKARKGRKENPRVPDSGTVPGAFFARFASFAVQLRWFNRKSNIANGKPFTAGILE
jgi:hypothetical protein